MSKGFRITLALATLFFGAVFVWAAIFIGNNVPAGPLPFYGMAAFCFVVATACLSGRSRVVTLPIIAIVLVAAAWQASPSIAVTILAVVGVALLALAVLYAYMRWRHRVLLRAARMLHAGNSEGAHALLQDQLRRDGPSARIYDHLATLFALELNWPEVLRMVEEAERMGDPQANVLATKGLALWKLGRVPEALGYLKEALLMQPNDLIYACHYGCALAESSRWVEASEVLERAEQLFNKTIVLAAASDRQLRKQALEQLRRSLSEARGRAWDIR